MSQCHSKGMGRQRERESDVYIEKKRERAGQPSRHGDDEGFLLIDKSYYHRHRVMYMCDKHKILNSMSM